MKSHRSNLRTWTQDLCLNRLNSPQVFSRPSSCKKVSRVARLVLRDRTESQAELLSRLQPHKPSMLHVPQMKASTLLLTPIPSPKPREITRARPDTAHGSRKLSKEFKELSSFRRAVRKMSVDSTSFLDNCRSTLTKIRDDFRHAHPQKPEVHVATNYLELLADCPPDSDRSRSNSLCKLPLCLMESLTAFISNNSSLQTFYDPPRKRIYRSTLH